MTLQSDSLAHALSTLIREDALGQLCRHDGRMAWLGSEHGVIKLDWVQEVQDLLADPHLLEAVEQEARALWQRGIRHVIWAGMGGSGTIVGVVNAMGCFGESGMALYPLESTDPAILVSLLEQLAQAKGLPAPDPLIAQDVAWLQELCSDVVLIGAAMGLTSEEPITHLAWFLDLLASAHLSPEEHVLVLSVPGSHLERFARARQLPSLPVFLHTTTGYAGRMSTPATRIFLLPAALALLGTVAEGPGALRVILERAWQQHDLTQAQTHLETHPFVRLGAALHAASHEGICRLFLHLPADWRPLFPWIEQLLEQSLGKQGKGVLVFAPHWLNTQAPGYQRAGMLHVYVTTSPQEDRPQEELAFVLMVPSLDSAEPVWLLAQLAAHCLGWHLSMAVYAYLQGLPFATEPAVERYKALAHLWRGLDDPLEIVSGWQEAFQMPGLTLLAPPSVTHVPATPPAQVVASALREAMQPGTVPELSYLDVTLNGVITSPVFLRFLETYVQLLGQSLLGVPVKVRQAPAAYHISEQSEVDGPPALISLRLLTRQHQSVPIGHYSDAFLHAQALATWQAMLERGRTCFLVILEGTPEHTIAPLMRFLTAIEQELHQPVCLWGHSEQRPRLDAKEEEKHR